VARLDDLQRVEKAIVRIAKIGGGRDAARNRALQPEATSGGVRSLWLTRVKPRHALDFHALLWFKYC
jgi:hypothetical protein